MKYSLWPTKCNDYGKAYKIHGYKEKHNWKKKKNLLGHSLLEGETQIILIGRIICCNIILMICILRIMFLIM